MKNSCLFIFLTLLIFAVVKGEEIKSTKSIPDITTTIVSNPSIPLTKTIPDVTTVTTTIVSTKTLPTKSIDNLPISDLAKEYCGKGKFYTVRYDSENFICEGYDYYDTSGCNYYYVGEYTYTSFTDDCYKGKEIDKGIYSSGLIEYSSRCSDRYKHMSTFSFGNLSKWKRELLHTNGIMDLSEFSMATSIDELPVDDIAKSYCRGYDNIYVYIDETGFACTLQNNPNIGDGCLPPITQPKYVYSSFNLDCFNAKEIVTGLYYGKMSENGTCEDNFKDMNIFYLKGKSSKMVYTTKTPINTKTISTEYSTMSITTTSTTSTISTFTTTFSNTLPAKSITSIFTETNPTEFISTTTTTTSTTRTKTPQTKIITTTTTSTTNTTRPTKTPLAKIITTTTTVTVTESVKCVPKTITVKETVKLKETVTVTVQNEPTNIVDNENCAGKWKQCGGIGFKGPTCCKAGFKCRKLNQLYSHCI